MKLRELLLGSKRGSARSEIFQARFKHWIDHILQNNIERKKLQLLGKSISQFEQDRAFALDSKISSKQFSTFVRENPDVLWEYGGKSSKNVSLKEACSRSGLEAVRPQLCNAVLMLMKVTTPLIDPKPNREFSVEKL